MSASGGYVGDFSIGKGVSSPIHFMNPLEKGQYIFFSLPNYSQCNQVVIANDTSRTVLFLYYFTDIYFIFINVSYLIFNNNSILVLLLSLSILL